MDGNVISNLMGTGSSPSGKKQGKVDSDAFSSALDDATKTKNESAKANEALIDDTKHDAKSEKERARKAARADEEQQAKAAQGKVGDRTSPAYLRKLMAMNPDSLSTAERQSLRLGEFSSKQEAKAPAHSPLHSTVPHPMNMPQQAAATPQAAQNAKVSERVQAEVGQREEKIEEKREKAVRENTQDTTSSTGQPNLEQLMAKESNFTDELQKQGAADQARDRQSVIDQILQKIEVRNFNQRTELNLKLNPEYLGELRVKLVHSADGGVSANFETTSRRTRQLLKEAESELHEQAKEKGIRLGAMNFTVVDQV